MELQEESYTSQTCPACFKRHKPKGRDYICSCGFIGHRDVVGATNIRSKYLGGFGHQVVAEMAPASGIRYHPNISVASGFQRTGLKSEESTPIYRL
jgi:putative transposase